MAQTIYTSTRDVDVRKCEPQQLLRQNYLSEFRTEVEKAKARESLGIPDDISLIWGNIKGFISQQEDLVNYIKDSFNYTVENYNDIKSVQEALTYLFQVVTDYSEHKEEFLVFQNDLKKCQDTILNLQDVLNEYTEKFNTLQNTTDTMDLQVKQLLETTQKHDKSIQEHHEHIQRIENSFNTDVLYTTDLDDSLTIESDFGGFKKGTKVSDLEGKSISALFDQLLFPTTVRNLIRPTLTYSPYTQLIKVNTSGIRPTLVFTQNDAGPQISSTETITFNNNNYDSISNYSQVGQYKYLGSVTYSEGPKLINNKGEETDLYIQSGTITAQAIVNVTYPWFAGNTEKVTEQKLVQIGTNSGDIEVELSGRAVIKLPKVAKLQHITFDAGLGFLEIDKLGWEPSEEIIGGYSYNVWTKIDSYSKPFKHKINFTL